MTRYVQVTQREGDEQSRNEYVQVRIQLRSRYSHDVTYVCMQVCVRRRLVFQDFHSEIQSEVRKSVKLSIDYNSVDRQIIPEVMRQTDGKQIFACFKPETNQPTGRTRQYHHKNQGKSWSRKIQRLTDSPVGRRGTMRQTSRDYEKYRKILCLSQRQHRSNGTQKLGRYSTRQLLIIQLTISKTLCGHKQVCLNKKDNSPAQTKNNY